MEGADKAEPLLPREPTDLDLIRRSRQGDTGAFGILFQRQHRRVYLSAYQILGDRAAAEDVLQETFLALWTHLGDYQPRFALGTWLGRIATNKAIDRWRARRRQPQPLAERPEEKGWAPPVSSVSGTPERVPAGPTADATHRARWAQVQAIWDELAELLTPQQRAAFMLREIEGLPTAEVAAVLSCSGSTVRSHVSLARETLQRALAERYPEYLPVDR